MRFVLLNDVQRREIVNTVKPVKRDHLSYDNLNLYYALYDEETDSYLTLTYFMTEFIKRTEMPDPYDDYKFILMTKEGSYIKFVAEYHRGERFRNIKSPCPSVVCDERFREMIESYQRFNADSECGRELLKWAKQEDVGVTHVDVSGYDFLSPATFTKLYLENNNLFFKDPYYG